MRIDYQNLWVAKWWDWYWFWTDNDQESRVKSCMFSDFLKLRVEEQGIRWFEQTRQTDGGLMLDGCNSVKDFYGGWCDGARENGVGAMEICKRWEAWRDKGDLISEKGSIATCWGFSRMNVRFQRNEDVEGLRECSKETEGYTDNIKPP